MKKYKNENPKHPCAAHVPSNTFRGESKQKISLKDKEPKHPCDRNQRFLLEDGCWKLLENTLVKTLANVTLSLPKGIKNINFRRKFKRFYILQLQKQSFRMT
jgi:hypothetical protein